MWQNHMWQTFTQELSSREGRQSLARTLAQKSPSKRPGNGLRRLAHILPYLKDHYIPVDVSPALPSPPVALATFLTKSGDPLVAVACASGLLWVARTTHLEASASLQVPGVGPGGCQIRNLWVSNALRPFGAWSEIIVASVSESASGEDRWKAHRALVRLCRDGVELRHAVDDAEGPRQSHWPDHPLPPELIGLTGRVRFTSGVDPFEPEVRRAWTRMLDEARSPAEAVLVLGPPGSIRIEHGCQLRLLEADQVTTPSDRWIRSAALLPSADEHLRVVLATEGRHLEGASSCQESWQQLLRNRPIAVDGDPQCSSNEGWPDLLVALDNLRIVRFSWIAADLQSMWKQQVDAIEGAADLSDAERWLEWLGDRCTDPAGRVGEDDASLRRVIYLLAVDRLLDLETAPANLMEDFARLMADEVEARLLLPAVSRLIEALDRWESGEAETDLAPRFIWACYLKLPFQVQQLIDANVLSVHEDRRETLKAKSPDEYGRLLYHARQAVYSFVVARGWLRDAGLNVIRHVTPYVTYRVTLLPDGFGLRKLISLENGSSSYVAAIGNRKALLFKCAHDGLGEEAHCKLDLPAPFTVHVALPLTTKNGDAILLGSRQGHLSLWMPFASHPHHLGELARFESPVTAAEALPTKGQPLAAKILVACESAGRAQLHCLSLPEEGGEAQLREIDVSVRQIQTLVALPFQRRAAIVAGDGEDLVLLNVDLDQERLVAEEVGRRSLGSQVRSLALSNGGDKSPQLIACAEDGQIMSILLDQLCQPWRRVQWVFQLPRGGRELVPDPDGQSNLALSNGGDVIQLSTEGRQVFRFKSYDPAAAALTLGPSATGNDPWIVVGTELGRLLILRQTEESATLDAAIASLAKAGDLEQHPPRNQAAELGWLLGACRSGQSPADVYSKLRFRGSRHALATLAARGLVATSDIVESLVPTLSLRDLAHLLREYSGNDRQQVIRAVWPRLVEASFSSPFGDADLGAAGALLYELLSPSSPGRGSLTRGEVPRLPRSLLETDWGARLVGLHVLKELSSDAEDATPLLEPLLGALVSYPLRVAGSIAALVGGSTSTQPLVSALRALARLDRAAKRGVEAEIDAALAEAAASFEPWRAQRGLSGLLARLLKAAEPLGSGRGDAEERAWLELTGLIDEAAVSVSGPRLRHLLFQPVADWLPPRRPESWDSIEAWEHWLREARERTHNLIRRMDEADISLEGPDVQPWSLLSNLLHRKGLQALRRLVHAAEQRLGARVHVHLELRQVHWRSALEVEIELIAHLQSMREFRGVELALDLGSEGGLGSAGESLTGNDERELITPDHAESRSTFRFRGTVASYQAFVAVATRIHWRDEKPLVATHRLPLPPRRSTRAGAHSPLPRDLPATAAVIWKRVEALQAAFAVLILDEELGRDELIESLSDRSIVQVDLDEALKDYGPGRIYPDLLTYERILDALDAPAVPLAGQKKGRWRRIVVSPAEDSLQRLLSDPDLRPEADRLLASLRDRAGQRPPVLLVVGSRVAGLLRRRAGASVPLVEGHRLALSEPAVRAEIEAWLEPGGPTGTKSSRGRRFAGALDFLGGDLRLLHRLLQSQQQSEGSGLTGQTAPAERLLDTPEVRSLLQDELEDLEPAAVHLLIVAACATTQFPFLDVPAGLVAAEAVYSTARRGRAGKLLVRAGGRVDEVTAQRLRSDLASNQRTFRAEGFTLGGSSISHPGIRSLARLLGDEKEVLSLGGNLVPRRLAEISGSVVRALPPFATLIRAAMERGDSPSRLFLQLTGRHSPLSVVPLGDLARLGWERIQEVEPERDADQARMLARLGQVWHALTTGQSFPLRTLALAIATLTGTENEIVQRVEAAADGPDGASSRTGADNVIFAMRHRGASKSEIRHLLVLHLQESYSPGRLQEMRTSLLQNIPEEERGRTFCLLLCPRLKELPKVAQWITLGDHDIRMAAFHDSPASAFWATVRTKAGLAQLNPFRPGGALPPGSPLFFGRERERAFILERIREDSFLIVGGRQVGKTSLKNRIRYDLEGRDDLEILEFDGQGESTRHDLIPQLRRLLPEYAGSALDPQEILIRLIERAHERKRFPILIFNEIDGLVLSDPDFLWLLRRFHESGRARFLLVGYLHHAAEACNDRSSALFRWTSAPDGDSYMTLAGLSESAARELVEVLEQAPLWLAWESEKQKERALRLIFARVYRIPLLIQSVCQRLVDRLGERGRYFLRLDDVVAVLKEEGLAPLANIGTYDPEKILPELPKDVADDFIDLVLATAAKYTYFEGSEAPIDDPDLLHRDPRTITFSANAVVHWLLTTLPRVLFPHEVEQAREIMEKIYMRKLLFALTLTPLLSVLPSGDRFFFQLHLYPREVDLDLKPGQTIDDRILTRLFAFSRHVSKHPTTTSSLSPAS